MGLYKFESKRHGTITVSIIDSELQFYCPHKREVYGKPFKYTGDNEYVEFRYHPHPDKKMTAKEFSGFIDLVEGDILSSGEPPPPPPPPPKRKGGTDVYPELEKKKPTRLPRNFLEFLHGDMFTEIFPKLDNVEAENLLRAAESLGIQIPKKEYYRFVIYNFSLFSNITHGVDKNLVVNLRFDGDIEEFNPEEFTKLERVYFNVLGDINGVILSKKLNGLKSLHALILEGQEWLVNQVTKEALKFLPQSITTFGFSGLISFFQLEIFFLTIYDNLISKGIPYTVILRDNFKLFWGEIARRNFPLSYINSLSSMTMIRRCTTLISRHKTLLKIREEEDFETENLIIQNPEQKIDEYTLNSFPHLHVFEFSGAIYYLESFKSELATTDLVIKKFRKTMNFASSITHVHVFGDVVSKFNPSGNYYLDLSVLRLPKYHWNSSGHIDLKVVPNLTVLELPVGADLENLPESLRILVLTNFEDLDLKYEELGSEYIIFRSLSGYEYGLPNHFPQSIEVFSISPKARPDYLEKIMHLVSNLKNLVKYQGPVLTVFSESVKNGSIETIYVGEDSSGELEEQWIEKIDYKKTKHIDFLKFDFKLHASWEKPWWKNIRQKEIKEIKDPNKND